MKTTANISTHRSRFGHLEVMLETIFFQFDEINIYLNNCVEAPSFLRKYRNLNFKLGDDLTDNGKFYFLSELKEDCYYFTLDDDLLYPKNYVDETIKKINIHGCIVTYHGREIISEGRNYYTGNKAYRCLDAVNEDVIIDVAGTGVTAFKTDYFKPIIHNSEYKLMSDLVFSLEASKKNKKIVCAKHEHGWIRPILLPDEFSIYESFRNKDQSIQNKIADEIFRNKIAKKNK